MFQCKVNGLKLALNNFGFKPEKEIVEFSIYDTKMSHDYAWLNKEHSHASTGI